MLSCDQIARFNRDGYLVVEDVLTDKLPALQAGGVVLVQLLVPLSTFTDGNQTRLFARDGGA